MTANPSRDAFLTSAWIEFCKENYASEEKNEREFRRKWAKGEITGKIVAPFSVGQPPTPAKSMRKVPEVPSLPWQPPGGHVAATDAAGTLSKKYEAQHTERPYYMGEQSFFDRSLKAEAVMDQSIVAMLNLRLSKENRVKLKSKFSQSNAVRGCLDFRPPRTEATSASLKTSSRSLATPSPRARARALRRLGSGASSRSQSRQSNKTIARTAPIQPNATTAKAFAKMQLRLDEKVGLPLSLQQLTLKNAFRKAQQGNSLGILHVKSLERVLLSLGMANTFEDGGRKLVAQFCQGDDIRFLELIKSYLDYTAKSRVNPQ